jgi:hypothetical protein
MGLPPQFAGMGSLTNMQQMMGMMGMNPNLGMPQPQDTTGGLKPLPPPGAGLLGDMPLAMQMNNSRNLPVNDEVEMQLEDSRKRRPDRRENRERLV